MSIFLHFPAPPNLKPIQFEHGLQSGDRVMVACFVSRGDPPIVIEWYKDYILIDNDNLLNSRIPGVSVDQNNRFTSVLMIDPIQLSHAGKYTCKASNEWASRSVSGTLSVNGMKNNLRYEHVIII